jgi:leader peptidase (prepilin peptidase)/N-methyltransferase
MIDIIFVLMLGLIIGSFLNCVIYRLEVGDSFAKGRSYCPNCKHTLSHNDLVPVFSFLFLKGKCRYCKQKISLQYPLVELAIAILFLINWLNFSNNIWQFGFYCAIIFIMAVIFIYDLKHCLVPVDFVYAGLIITALFHIIKFTTIYSDIKLKGLTQAHGFWLYISPYFWGAMIPFLFFWFLYFVSKEKWMGLGDSKIVLLMGFILGLKGVFISLLLANFLGAIIGLILISFEKKGLKSEMAFGPFLVIGFFIVLYFKEITYWFYNLFYL